MSSAHASAIGPPGINDDARELAGSAGVDGITKRNGTDCSGAVGDSGAVRFSDDAAVTDLNEGKRFLAVMAGFTMHLLAAPSGGAAFLLSRWNLTRELPDLAAVSAFLDRVVGVRRA